jgi:hypothetical protein
VTKFLEATYTKGNLILSEALSPDLEGKKLRVLILETPETDEELTREEKLTRFLEHAKQVSFKLPKDYKFVRDEIYDR